MGEIDRRFRGTNRLPESESRSDRPDLSASEGENEEADDCECLLKYRPLAFMTSAHCELLSGVVDGYSGGDVIGDAEFSSKGRGATLGFASVGLFVASDNSAFVLWTNDASSLSWWSAVLTGDCGELVA